MKATGTAYTFQSRILWTGIRLAELLASACAAIFIGGAIFVMGTRLFYAGRAFPGVSAGGVSLSGMDRSEIERALKRAIPYPETGRVLLSDGDRIWSARPDELGLRIDIPSMAEQALMIGREGGFDDQIRTQLEVWHDGFIIAPLLTIDQGVAYEFLASIAERIDRPQFEATLSMEGAQVEMRPGQVGRRLDIPGTIDLLTPAISQLHDTEIPLVVEETPPLIMDASEQAEIAANILSEPLVLTAEDAGPWVFDPKALAAMIQINLVSLEDGPTYQVGLDPEPLREFLAELAQDLAREPENARFIFNDQTGELDLLRPAVEGRSLDIEASLAAINERLIAGQHQAPLILDIIEPQVGDNATAAELGISEPVSVVSTYFAGSNPERVQNIKVASGAFHGLLVPPGGTLSMAEILGDISLDNGYAEALIIYGNRTIKGVGGGVCQVSTTLFRAAFFGGFEIVERHPHAYRVSYYEQGPNSPGPGLDATVFVPEVDFRFTNDSDYWLLLETYVYGDQLLWKFYSTSDGRQVDWHTSGPKKVAKPKKPVYHKNPELPKGTIKQVEWEAEGMDVVIQRTVTREGELLHEDRFKTHYLPWRSVYEYGPGTKLPKNAKIE